MSYFTSYSMQDRLWTVGYFDPSGEWHGIRDCDNEDEAFAFVNFLAGGSGRNFQEESPASAIVDNSATILTISRVVTMLQDVMHGGNGARDLIAQAIANLNVLGAELMKASTQK